MTLPAQVNEFTKVTADNIKYAILEIPGAEYGMGGFTAQDIIEQKHGLNPGQYRFLDSMEFREGSSFWSLHRIEVTV